MPASDQRDAKLNGAQLFSVVFAFIPRALPSDMFTFGNVPGGGWLRYTTTRQGLSCAGVAYALHRRLASFPARAGFRAGRRGSVSAARAAKSE
jgi:hypothetical protein